MFSLVPDAAKQACSSDSVILDYLIKTHLSYLLKKPDILATGPVKYMI